MLITANKLSVDFNDYEAEMEHQLEELKRLEKAIEDSTHYKLLAGKTQMISKGRGKVKKERSRIQHTKVIAESVVKPLIEKIYDKILEENDFFKNNDEYRRKFELNKQIAIARGMVMVKAHDIGHVAFGHEGEKAINEFYVNITNADDIEAVLAEHLKYFGSKYEENQGHISEDVVDEIFPSFIDKRLSFEHNELGGILFNKIIEKNSISLPPSEILALTLGVLGHTTSRTPFELLKDDLVAQIVRVADKVEYINADYDEISKLIEIDSSRLDRNQMQYIEKTCYERICETVSALAEEALATGKICEKNPVMQGLSKFRKSYDDLIYLYDGSYADKLLKKLLTSLNSPEEIKEIYTSIPGSGVLYPPETLDKFIKYRELVKRAKDPAVDIREIDLENAYDMLVTEQVHFKGILQGENSDRIALMYSKILNYYYEHVDEIPEVKTGNVSPIDYVNPEEINYTLNPNQTPIQKVREYISLLDDEGLIEEYHRLVKERIEKGEGFGIVPITMDEIKVYLRNSYEQEVDKYRHQPGMDFTVELPMTEAKRKYNAESKKFFEGLTERGRSVMMGNMVTRMMEYAEDASAYKLMQEKDEERKKQSLGSQGDAGPGSSSGNGDSEFSDR